MNPRKSKTKKGSCDPKNDLMSSLLQEGGNAHEKIQQWLKELDKAREKSEKEKCKVGKQVLIESLEFIEKYEDYLKDLFINQLIAKKDKKDKDLMRAIKRHIAHLCEQTKKITYKFMGMDLEEEGITLGVNVYKWLKHFIEDVESLGEKFSGGKKLAVLHAPYLSHCFFMGERALEGKGDIQKAYSYFHEMLEACHKTLDDEHTRNLNLAWAHISLGMVFLKDKQWELGSYHIQKAEMYYSEAYKNPGNTANLLMKSSLETKLSTCYRSLAEHADEQGNLLSAIKHYEKAQKFKITPELTSYIKNERKDLAEYLKKALTEKVILIQQLNKAKEKQKKEIQDAISSIKLDDFNIEYNSTNNTIIIACNDENFRIVASRQVTLIEQNKAQIDASMLRASELNRLLETIRAKYVVYVSNKNKDGSQSKFPELVPAIASSTPANTNSNVNSQSTDDDKHNEEIKKPKVKTRGTPDANNNNDQPSVELPPLTSAEHYGFQKLSVDYPVYELNRRGAPGTFFGYYRIPEKSTVDAETHRHHAAKVERGEVTPVYVKKPKSKETDKNNNNNNNNNNTKSTTNSANDQVEVEAENTSESNLNKNLRFKTRITHSAKGHGDFRMFSHAVQVVKKDDKYIYLHEFSDEHNHDTQHKVYAGTDKI